MAGARGLALKRPSAIPGFGLALGFTLTYLSLIVLIPLAALVLKSASLGVSGFWDVVTGPREADAVVGVADGQRGEADHDGQAHDDRRQPVPRPLVEADVHGAIIVPCS